MTSVQDIITQVAQELGVDPRLALAIAQQESGLNPNAIGDNGHSVGLFQLNDQGEGAGMTVAQRQDPETNARIALTVVAQVAQQHPDWSPGTIAAAAQRPADRAGYAASVDSIYSGGSSSSGYGATSTAGGGGPVGNAAPTSSYRLPAGGVVTTIAGAYHVVLYELPSGAAVWFQLDPSVDTSGLPSQDISIEQWQAAQGHLVEGGAAKDLDTIAKTYGNWNSYWNWLLDTHLGPNDAARNDPGVQQVMLQLAARPDMSPEELQNLLKNTDYWKSRTQQQLEWNDLSPEEQKKRIGDTMAQLQDQWFQLTGQTAPPAQALLYWASQVASGAKGFNEVVTTWIKPEAAKIPESPWSRTIRTEQENELQRGVDVENSTETVRSTAAKWGVQLADDTLASWGQGLVDKSKSDADLVGFLRQQAQILYPWMKQLDPSGETPTQDLATPWLQTYQRVMEKPGELLNPDIQKALQNGTPAWQFEQDLKKTDAWLSTKNAQDSILTAAGDLGRRMGF